jgi:uncharacterized protein
MKLFSVYLNDTPAAPTLRVTHLAAHLTFVETNMVRYAVAGPLRDAHSAIVGSLLILKGESIADTRAFLERDPYFIAGVWGDVEIREINAVAGEWVGGKAWGNITLTR